MTPKEKAEELYKRMYTQHSNIYPSTAKQCALIAVDEILDALAEYDDRNNTYELQNMDRDFNYWQEVKQEIGKL